MRYYLLIQDLQNKVIKSQRPALLQTAERMVTTIQAQGRLFIFGTGHSHMLAEEAFFRAGGLAMVVPVFSPMLMLHESPALSSRLERTPGLASLILDGYDAQPGEMMFIFSNSGVNHLPVEMALYAKERSLFVVSVSSLAYAQAAPLSTLGQRLDQVADIAIDNGGEPGDALAPVEGTARRVGPSSTIIGALIWNSLITETIDRLQAAGEELPVFASLNMPGAAEHNQALLDKWGKSNPHLR